jgi:hypothetical protein
VAHGVANDARGARRRLVNRKESADFFGKCLHCAGWTANLVFCRISLARASMRRILELRRATAAKYPLVALLVCWLAAEARAGCSDHVIVLANLSPEQRSLVIRMMIGGGCHRAIQTSDAPGCTQCPFAPLGDGPSRSPCCSKERMPEGAPLSPAPTRTADPWSVLLHVLTPQGLSFVGYLCSPLPILLRSTVSTPSSTRRARPDAVSGFAKSPVHAAQ